MYVFTHLSEFPWRSLICTLYCALVKLDTQTMPCPTHPEGNLDRGMEVRVDLPRVDLLVPDLVHLVRTRSGTHDACTSRTPSKGICRFFQPFIQHQLAYASHQPHQ